LTLWIGKSHAGVAYQFVIAGHDPAIHAEKPLALW
jgi:hypothetical protein